jgi:chitodextrinase
MGDLAARMQPGTWAELSTNGFSGSLLAPGGPYDSITQYADSAAWDSIRKKFFFLGISHSNPIWTMIAYDETSNSWSTVPLHSDFPQPDIGHGYDHNTVDSASGNFYHRKYNTKKIYRYNQGTRVWDTLPAMPLQNIQVANALKWFPDMKRLIYVDGDWGVFAFNPNNSQWTKLANTNGESGGGLPKLTMGSYHNVAEYDPVHRVLLFGGGGTKIYKMASDGTVTALKDAPITLGINSTLISNDPVSGKFLVFTNSAQFYEYDITTDTWALQPSSKSPPFFTNSADGPARGTVEAAVSNYGVVMFVTYNFNNSKVYLYKHAPSVPDTQTPTTPPNLTATAVSSSQIDLAWTASTDNIGVTGYRIYRNSTQVGTAATTNYVDTGLQASTTYVYTVAAYDAAGNQSAQSATASTKTLAPDTTPPTVAMTAPTSGATVLGSVTVSANATDNVGVAGVQFKLDGANLGVEDTTAPYAITWDTRAIANGTRSLTAVARDAASNTKTATAISVTVNNAVDTTAPTTPTNLTATAVSSSQINLAWTASTDNVGVAGYKVYRGGSQVGTSTSTSYSDNGLTAQTSYSYRIQAHDAAGNNSAQSTSVSATTLSSGSQPLAADFAARCSASGVLKCVGFDNPADIAGRWGNVSGIFTGSVAPVLDTAVKTSGASALKFTIPSNSGAGASGSYFTNFTDNLSALFGEGEEFYIQWRQRFSAEFLSTNYTGGGGWKQVIIGEGDRAGVCNPSNPTTATCPASCTQLEIVAQNTGQRGIPQMYHSCGGKDGRYEPLEYWDNNLGNIVHQNAVGCLYGSGYPEPPCVRYKPNQWMTFQIRVKIGTWYKNDRNYHGDSTIQLWVADEGQPSKLVLDFRPENGHGYDIANTDTTAPLAEYGKVWLLPYHTGKSDAQSHPTGYVWYDELIISRNKIAEPSPGSSNPAPLAAPTNLVVTGN